jgi:predicted nucleic acid-binding protein
MSAVDDPLGPFVFDTSAESWLVRSGVPEVQQWMISYLERHPVFVSAITVVERLNGYNLALRRATAPEDRDRLKKRRADYVGDPTRVLPVDVAVAAAASELMALVPDPPSPPKRSHQAAESRSDRLARWRFDVMVAATALVNRMPVMHNNPEDFEALRMAIEIAPERLGGLGPLDLYRCTRIGAGRVRASAGR